MLSEGYQKGFAASLRRFCCGEGFGEVAIKGDLLVKPSGEVGIGSGSPEALGDEGIVVLIEFGTIASKALADLVFIHGREQVTF